MRFYTNQHRYYCGIDLHARSMYVCILDPRGQILLHRNMPCAPESFLKAIAPYREDIAVAVECIFTCTGSPTSVANRTSPSSWATRCT